MPDHKIINAAIVKIFDGIEQLRDAFPTKRFTIDGRLVGDIGEAIVQRDYDVKLYDKVAEGYDGETTEGRRVQIKATFQDSLTIAKTPDYYLGIKIFKDGTYEEIFNGPGRFIEEQYGHRKGYGEELLSFPIPGLKELSKKVPGNERIEKRS